MLAGLRRRFDQARFDRICRRVLATPPLRPRAASVTLVSMVRHADVPMAVLALKSLHRQLPGGVVHILDDGSLTPADHDLLRHHLGTCAITPIAAVATGPCPRGGCWERLLHILDLSRDFYVIQVDSDVLTLGPVQEVVEAIAANRAFTLTSEAQFGIVGLEQAAADVAAGDPRHTQFLAEQSLPRLPVPLGRRYVRGSAGFAGFPRGGPDRATAEAFSAAMQALMGSRWAEWGTEQVASNWLVANSPGALVLPWARYRCFYGEAPPPGVALLHFIGTWRFQRGRYPRLAREVIASLGHP